MATATTAAPDKLVVAGLGSLDGEYAFDIAALLGEGHPDCLTNREGHRVKVMSGVRAGEIMDALEAGDNDLIIALSAVILTRHGRRFDEAVLWDAPMGSALDFAIAERSDVDKNEQDPTSGPPAGAPETSSGDASGSSSENPENDPSPTGLLDLDTSADYDPATSAT